MNSNDAQSETFMVKARRCKRCGGLLTSAQAVADGYGHVCKMKELGERLAKEPLKGQMALFEDMEEPKE
jgi:hypothetical protein